MWESYEKYFKKSAFCLCYTCLLSFDLALMESCGKIKFSNVFIPTQSGENEKAEWQFLYTSQIYPLWNFVLTLLWNCPSAMKEIFGKAAHQVSFLRDDVLACICINIISGSGDEAHMSAHWLCYHSLHEPILGRWLPLVYSSLLTNYRCFTSSLVFPV